jgi:hypothetical protein
MAVEEDELERRRSDVKDVLSTHQQVHVQVRRLITQDWTDAVLNYKTETWTLMKKSVEGTDIVMEVFQKDDDWASLRNRLVAEKCMRLRDQKVLMFNICKIFLI